ncbi:MAG TPA: ATP-binding protein [Solirubrobacteraceae bacterium]|jgi:PAS domain S-box-containing protein/diguanylate cyclase (GGDEF)-like protein
MVGEDADRGDSRLELRTSRRTGTTPRQDLQAGSLASWSRALDDQRRELLAGVGHELKTPLSIVLGLCGRLLATELGDSQAQDVERVRANAYVLLKRVEELLQVSRLDGGHLELELRDVDVARLVRASCEGFASVAELRQQRLVVEAPTELPAHVDEEKLLSVVSNLLANALKHAPQRGIVRCTVAANGDRLRIEVADNGPGVADGLRKEIFERYRQGAGSAARPGGSGLGLAIVRDLVSLHGGMVTLADAPEGGALFAVDLPLRTEDAADGRAAPPPTIDVVERQRPTVERLRAELVAAGRRGATPTPQQPVSDRPSALIVTADAELGAFVQELIARRYAVRHAADPLQAARLIAADRPAAVLFDAAAGVGAIAALHRRLGEVPLLTFAASPEDVPRLIAAGAHDCVVKPFAADELQARLDALVARGHAATRRQTTIAGLDRAFDVAPLATALVSVDGRLVRVNRALCGLLGFTPDELLRHTVQDLTHPDELRDEETRRRAVFERRVMADRARWRLARADGSYVHVAASASLVDDGGGAEPCLLLHLSDTVEEPRAGGADVLAGPPGRRAFERAVRHQLLRCRRYGEQAALVRCSLDGLPAVRAEHGTEAADRLIAMILDAVRSRLRSTDVVAYIGDNEIAALLAHADLDAAHTTAEALREAAESQQVATQHGPVCSDAEVGVASLARAGSPGRAFVEAGLAMHGRDGDTGRLRRFRPARPSEPGDMRLRGS